MIRIEQLNNQFAKAGAPVIDVWKSMGLDQYLRPQFVTLKDSVERKLEILEN